MLRALIIEDEAAARLDLRAKLAAHPQVTVVGEAATFRNARALLSEAEYELVFLDIQLVGGHAFDLVPDVRPGARVVFATAHDEHALRAFAVNALDYLLKPVTAERLAETMQRLPATGASASAEPVKETGALQLDDVVHLHAGSRARFAKVTDILLITANDNYTDVRLADGAHILVRRSLSSWEVALPAAHFMRVHRTQIVNLGRVVEYRRDRDEHTSLFLAGWSEPVRASRERWPELRERLAGWRVRE